MISWLLSKVVPWQMRRLKFEGQGGVDARVNTQDVIEAFLLAAEASLRGASRERLMELEAAHVPWPRRTFFWEGHAFGVCGALAFDRGSTTPHDIFVAPGFRFMLYTGLGVWNGLASQVFLPTISLEAERWAHVPDFQGCRPLISGGAAFGVLAQIGRFERAALERLAQTSDDPWWRHGVYQGAGRAAWFFHMRNPKALTALLDSLGEDARPVAEGLGIAITFTQLGEPERVAASIQGLPARLHDALWAGSRLCLSAAGEDDSRLVETLEAMPHGLADCYREGRSVLNSIDRGPQMPPQLIEGLYRFSRPS